MKKAWFLTLGDVCYVVSGATFVVALLAGVIGVVWGYLFLALAHTCWLVFAAFGYGKWYRGVWPLVIGIVGFGVGAVDNLKLATILAGWIEWGEPLFAARGDITGLFQFVAAAVLHFAVLKKLSPSEWWWRWLGYFAAVSFLFPIVSGVCDFTGLGLWPAWLAVPLLVAEVFKPLWAGWAADKLASHRLDMEKIGKILRNGSLH